MYRMASAAVTTDTGLNLSASYTYEDDLLTKIQTASTTYNFTYGNFGLRSSVKVGTQALATYSYTQDGNNYLSSLDYGNGDKVQYEYDNLGRVTKQTYEDGDTVAYQYDNSGALATVTDSATGRKTTYYYDFTDRLMKYVETGTGYYHSVGYEYDQLNNLTSLVETINGTDYTTSYVYDDDNRVTSVTTNGTTVEYTYDTYGRISQQVTKRGDTTILTETYTYVGTDTTTSGQIATYKTETANYSVTYSYTYDDNGNILSVNDGTYTTTYVYDSANQLIRENNQNLNFTYTWTYDNAGNILGQKTYHYTIEDLSDIAPIANSSYAYSDENWGDLLTAYNGAAISYDEIGNPISDGTRSYTWEHGRELSSLTKNNVTWNYTYDSNGMRTSRTNGTKTYQYVYNGSQLMQMSVGSYTFSFTYDASGTPQTISFDGDTYYYVTNIQGDVVGILNEDGEEVIHYGYDAYGQLLYDGVGDIGRILLECNPLTYRGYVYDGETGLYYLQSRYYDPALGRFINADAFASTGQGLIGNNMFAYCLNNPIMFADFTGARAQVWQVLFGDHNPGYIHRAVQFHILFMNNAMGKELTIPGTGRADIYNPNTCEMWEIKYGGSTNEMKNERILSADSQVSRYVKGANEVFNSPYQKGHAGAFEGKFILTCDSFSYLITYDTPADGVILYYVEQLKKKVSTAPVVYPSKDYRFTKNEVLWALGAGAVSGVAVFGAYVLNKDSSNRGLQLGLAY